MHVIGRPAVQATFFVLLVALLLSGIGVRSANASPHDDTRGRSTSDMRKSRVCDRLTVLHARLPHIVPLPKFCKDAPPPPPNPISVDLTATPSSVLLGTATNLSWTSSVATTCIATGGWAGTKTTTGNELQVPNADTTYSLTCGNGLSSSTDSVTVLVVMPPPPSVDLSASSESILAGATSTLTWTSTGSSACSASLGWSGIKALSGTEVVLPGSTTTYSITCGNGTATSSDSVTILVTEPPPIPIVDLTVSPEVIYAHETATLTWNSSHARTCDASNGWTGSQAQSGTLLVQPSTTTTYTLSCGNGTSTSTDTVTLTVTPTPVVTVSLTATNDSIETGENATLVWTSTNAMTCSASMGWTGEKNLAGSEMVTPATTTTYTLTCGNGLSTSTVSEIVTVTEPPAPIATVELSAEQETINLDDTVNLVWSSTDADTCLASGAWTGNKTPSGTDAVSPTTTSTYTLSCGNGTSTSTDSVTITVILPPPPTVTLSADPNTIEEGDGTNIEWTSMNADTCVASGGWVGSKDLQGVEEVAPTISTEYTLTCTNSGGEGQATTTVTVVPPRLDHLIISEVYYDPDNTHGADPANEWVEIHNPTSSERNLAGFVIADANSSDALPSISIPPLGFVIITASSTTANLWTFPSGVPLINIGSTIGNGLSNTGDALYLKNANNDIVDALSYGTSIAVFDPAALDVDDGHSLARTSLTSDSDTASDWENRTIPTPGM